MQKIMVRRLQKIKAEKSVCFCFLLDQKVKKLERDNEVSFEKISKTIMICVDRLAPEKEHL